MQYGPESWQPRIPSPARPPLPDEAWTAGSGRAPALGARLGRAARVSAAAVPELINSGATPFRGDTPLPYLTLWFRSWPTPELPFSPGRTPCVSAGRVPELFNSGIAPLRRGTLLTPLELHFWSRPTSEIAFCPPAHALPIRWPRSGVVQLRNRPSPQGHAAHASRAALPELANFGDSLLAPGARSACPLAEFRSCSTPESPLPAGARCSRLSSCTSGVGQLRR